MTQHELFTPSIVIHLTPEERAIATRPIVADTLGGWQTLLHDLLPRLDCYGAFEATDSELRRCYRYAYDYASGGYQGRFKAILAAARRAGWQAV